MKKIITRFLLFINSKINKDVNLYEPITMESDSEEKMQLFVYRDLDLMKKITTSASAANISKHVYYYFPPEEETEGSPIPRHPRTPGSE